MTTDDDRRRHEQEDELLPAQLNLVEAVVGVSCVSSVTLYALFDPIEQVHQLDRQREDDRRVLLGGDLGQRLQVAQRDRHRLGRR